MTTIEIINLCLRISQDPAFTPEERRRWREVADKILDALLYAKERMEAAKHERA